MNLFSRVCVCAFATAALGVPASAAALFQDVSGAIVTAGHVANFNGVATGSLLTSYEEDGIRFAFTGSGGTAYVNFTPAPGGFSGGFYYAAGASADSFLVSMANGTRIRGIEFSVGTGYFAQYGRAVNVMYELVRDSVAIASGVAVVDTSGDGARLGFREDGGFDSIRLANYEFNPTGFQSTGNGLALDNVVIDVATVSNGQPSAVPEPSTFLIMCSTTLVYALLRKL